MTAFLRQLDVTLRLHFRNRMALLYGYLFPTIFLIAFWVLYRYDQVPLLRHIGELLTVTALGGACFGLPTTMVSERERGVWRRYRLAPIATASLIGSTLISRYFLLLTAGALQVVLAVAIGMPWPRHPFHLLVAFTFVSFAFLGMGLVIAMLADNVPAVQALGQCVFLPMLIIGGVAVRLEALPGWAHHLSAFFPGRYAVAALQGSAALEAPDAMGFELLALFLIGAAGLIAGTRMFRWDARERFASRGRPAWIAVALAGWAAVGVTAEQTGRIAPGGAERPERRTETIRPAVTRGEGPAPLPPLSTSLADSALPADTPLAVTGDSVPRPAPVSEDPPPTVPPQPWQAVTLADILRTVPFDGLPPDAGVVTPIAASAEPEPEIADQIECMRRWLPEWEPAQVAEPVQRVRNYLYVASVTDMHQIEQLESLVPWVVFERLLQEFSRDELMKILYWIVSHRTEGEIPPLTGLTRICLEAHGAVNLDELRERNAVYATKLLGRLTGKIGPR